MKKKKNKKEKHYMRIRPKEQTNAAFYAPAADITHGMKGVLSSVLKQVFSEEVPEGHPKHIFSNNLALFMKSSALKNKLWEEDGITQLEKIFDGLDPKDATAFIYRFFMVMMDYYWHSMRLTTESSCIDPEEMSKALSISQILRTMPKEMREEYLDHLKTYNMLPEVFFEGALFQYYRGEIDDDAE